MLLKQLPAVLAICLIIFACGKKEAGTTTQPPSNPPTNNPPPNNPPPGGGSQNGYDLETKGIPQFATANYIELSKIQQITKFRSDFGHDYSDNFEKCRSMKHYFLPFASADWSSVKIYSPVTGTITKIDDEWAGKQVRITPDGYSDFLIILFHVNLSASFPVGTKVTAGQQIGTHISNQTMSDIGAAVNTTKGYKLISWFDVMNDAVFDLYKARGIQSRAEMIISKDARDADPITCTGEAFTVKGKTEPWKILN
jgi:hypothetical protein